MTGMKRGCCGKSYKDGAVELVAGGSFAGMQSEKVCPHQSKLDVWSYFPIFFFKKQALRSRAQMPKQLKLKKLLTVCFL